VIAEHDTGRVSMWHNSPIWEVERRRS
jgi:hypothetical protein